MNLATRYAHDGALIRIYADLPFAGHSAAIRAAVADAGSLVRFTLSTLLTKSVLQVWQLKSTPARPAQCPL